MNRAMETSGCEGPDKGVRPIRHVGVCADLSRVGDRIVPHAIALARVFGAKVTVLHALEPPHEGSSSVPTDPLEWEVQRNEAQEHLAAVESECGADDLAIECEVLEGHPAEEIRDWASRHDVDLTALSSHGESGCTEWSLASTARKLLEGTSGSVLLVPAWSIRKPVEGGVTYGRILVLLDGSPRAESALPVATSVARAHASELILLHVVSKPERSCPGRLTEEERDLDRRLVDRNAHVASEYLEGLREHLAAEGVRARTRVSVDGDVRGEILRRTAEDRVDLVVFSGQGRGGRAEVPFGSVAGFLLEHATSPLLMVRERTPRSQRTLRKGREEGRLPSLAAP